MKNKHGGKRLGVGRPAEYNEETKTIAFRCPISKIPELKEIIKCKLLDYKSKSYEK
jgi:hypothetical protein